jgi:hypothetical protein
MASFFIQFYRVMKINYIVVQNVKLIKRIEDNNAFPLKK